MRISLAIILLAVLCTPCLADMEVVVVGQPAAAACADESCTGDCLFSCSWEGSGADNVNTGGVSTFDAVAGTVTYGTSTWETSCIGHSVTMANDGNYLSSTNGGSYWNKGLMYLRFAFKITAESMNNGDYNYVISGWKSDLTVRVMSLTIYQTDPKFGIKYEVYDGAAYNTIGQVYNDADHGFALNTWYSCELYYDDTAANASEKAGWRLWDASGTLLVPAAGTWEEETTLDLYTDQGLDVIQVGPSRGQDNFSMEIDKIRFSGAAIGAPTR